MNPLDPRLKELLRRHANGLSAPTSPPPGFAATVLARRHVDATAGASARLDQILFGATVLSLLVIAVVGISLAYRSHHPPATSNSWVTASQFAASRFMP